MTVKLTDKVYNEAGSPVQGAIAQAILTDGTTAGTIVATDTTDSKGIWAFDSTIAGHQPDLADPAAGQWYDVRINAGMQYRLRYGAIKAMMNMIYLSQNIVMGATQLIDVSLAALKIPAKAADPASPSAGQFLVRTDTHNLRYHDGSGWYDAASGPSLAAHIAATSAHGGSALVVGTDNVQTLTNKTLTAPSINNPTVTGTLSVTGTSTFTGVATHNQDIVLNANRTLVLGGAGSGGQVSPGPNIGRSLDTVYISNHAYVYWDFGNGHDIHSDTGYHFARGFNVVSDPRMKTTMTPVSQAACLAEVLDSRVQTYTYQLSAPPSPPPGYVPDHTPASTTDYGFSADEVLQVVPEVVTLDANSQPSFVAYSSMVPIVWGAIRELERRVGVLEAA